LTTIWGDIKKQVFETYGCYCVKCKSNKKLDIHHIIPRNLGGSDNIQNLIPLCRSCHLKIEGLVRRFSIPNTQIKIIKTQFVLSDFRLALPKLFCFKNKLKEGDIVLIEENEKGLLVMPADVKPRK
jgi:predicted transcriptional regulator